MRFEPGRMKFIAVGLLTTMLAFGVTGCSDDDGEDDGTDTGVVDDTGMQTDTETPEDTGMDTMADGGEDTGDMPDDGGMDAGDTSMDSDGPSATARLQVIHNAADPGASTVDVFLDGELFIDDFEFRTATEYVDAPADTGVTITVAGSDAGTAGDDTTLDDDDTVLGEWSGVTLTEDETYVAVASGVGTPDDFASNPDGKDIALDLKLFEGAKEESSQDGTTDEVLVFHGATDAPTVDIVADNGQDPAVDDAMYGDFQGYLPLGNGIHTLDVETGDNTSRVGSFQTPDLGGGSTFTVAASGFLSPSDNQSGPGLALVAFPATAQSGDRVDGIELSAAARAQIIHASPDPGASTVDVYLNGELLADDFDFLTATSFLSLPSGVDHTIDVAPSDSSGVGDSIYDQTVSLPAGSTNVAVASGVLDPSSFQGSNNGFMIRAGEAREAAETSGNAEFNIFHASPDATAVLGGPIDAVVAGGSPVLADDLGFGSFSGIASVAPGSYTIEVQTGDNSMTAASFTADLSGLADAYVTVVAKGFVSTDDGTDPSNGEPFGLVAFDTDGNKIMLPAATN